MEKEVLIQKYNRGELTPLEEAEFKRLLKTDTEFKALFKEFTDVNKVIESLEKDELKAQLKKLENKTKQNNLKKWLIAASVIIFLGLGSSYYFIEKQDTSATLYATYFDVYPNVLAPVVRGEEELQPLSKAMLAYENGQYDKALELLETILVTNKNENIRFYKAMCLLNKSKTEDALLELNNLEETKFKQQVLWYKALIYLKQDNIKKSKEKLKEAIRIKHFFKLKEAKLLLEKIE